MPFDPVQAIQKPFSSPTAAGEISDLVGIHTGPGAR